MAKSKKFKLKYHDCRFDSIWTYRNVFNLEISVFIRHNRFEVNNYLFIP